MVLPLPLPYPDELLYSMISRWHVRKGALNEDKSIELFSRKLRPSIGLPTGLSGVSASFFGSLAMEEIIEQNTLYPYYATLQSKPSSLYNDIINFSSNRNIETRKRLSCCPICVRNDSEMYGEPYWHRSHHLPGVHVCPEHNVLLLERCPVCIERIVSDYDFLRYAITPTHCFKCHSWLQAITNDNEILLTIAEDNFFILKMAHLLKREIVREIYRDIFLQAKKEHINNLKNMVSPTYFEELCSDQDLFNLSVSNRLQHLVVNSYGYNFLKGLGIPKVSPLYYGGDYTPFILDDKTYIPTIHHVLILGYFFGSVRNFIEKIATSAEIYKFIVDEVAATSDE